MLAGGRGRAGAGLPWKLRSKGGLGRKSQESGSNPSLALRLRVPLGKSLGHCPGWALCLPVSSLESLSDPPGNKLRFPDEIPGLGGAWNHNCQLRFWEPDSLLLGVHEKDLALFKFREQCFHHHNHHTTTTIPFQSFGLL